MDYFPLFYDLITDMKGKLTLEYRIFLFFGYFWLEAEIKSSQFQRLSDRNCLKLFRVDLLMKQNTFGIKGWNRIVIYLVYCLQFM